jgi:hypothetical protein
VIAGTPLHLHGVAAGLIDLLLAERADHWFDLLADGACQANKDAGPGFPCVAV